LCAVTGAPACLAGEELIITAKRAGGETVPYILNRNDPEPKYVVILFPGGAGTVNPRIEGGRLVYGYAGNFLVRSRHVLVDDEFATVTTNTTRVEEDVQAVLDDIARRFPQAQVYLMGTSNGTYATMALADYLSERIAGEIHTSSLQAIYGFDARKYKNRHLVVHHKRDTCRVTPFNAAEASRERFGNAFIAMEGGVSEGDACEAFSHHGYNGIERETMAAIKNWVKQPR
jgi:predicted esterase